MDGSPGKLSMLTSLPIRCLAALSASLFLLGSPLSAQPAPAADGLFITVQNPITEGGINLIKSSIDKAKNSNRNIKKIIFDFNPDGKEASTESYGPCYELAKYIRILVQNGQTPIAFVHGKTTSHSVLPVLACEDVVMSSGATLGEVASKDRPVTRPEQDYYLDLAGFTRAAAVARMFDRDVKIVQGLYKGSPIYVDLRKVESKDPAYADVRVTNPNPVPLTPGVALYNIEQARLFGICKLQKESRAEVAEWYQISPSADGDDIEGAIRACRIMVEGTIDVPMREKIRRQIEAAKARKENFFFFVLECGGGDAAAANEIAAEILKLNRDPNYKARTVAFVPNKASDLAVFIAFACQDLVMYKGPTAEGEAVIGDFDNYLANQKKANPEFLNKALDVIAEERGVPKILISGMFDKNLVIVNARNTKTGDRKLMDEAELRVQADKVWVSEGVVKEKGVLLKFNASKAKNLRLAKTIDNKDIAEAYALYGIDPKGVREAAPSLLDNFAAMLRRTEVSILLVVVGIACLVLEMKAPGLIVPGVISAICFVLFFWAQTQLGGELIYLAIMLFLLGLALVGIEIFLIPGFGITGVSGILLILAGLVLAGLDRAPEDSSDWIQVIRKALQYGLTMAGAGVLAFIVSRWLPNIPYANRLMLIPPEDKLEEEPLPLPGMDHAISMLGQVGTATSMLRPAGMAKFGDQYIDVVTEGDFIAPGTSIQVVEVEGTRIVVKKV
jgi:membrane-bound serine protease (ClpP class)